MAARSGAGLALLPHYIGRSEKNLYACSLELVPPPREAWLLTRRQQRKDLPIRTVAEYITKIFATERVLFEE
jgi:DNA-binding transcriptional LysR family regulator